MSLKSRPWLAEYDFGSGVIRWQISVIKIYKSRSLLSFTLALGTSEILALQTFDLEKVGQGRGQQHSRWCHLMANMKIHKRHFLHF